MLNFNEYLAKLSDNECSELYFTTGLKPCLRKNGTPYFCEESEPCTREEIESIIKNIVPSSAYNKYLEQGNTSFSHSVPGVGRYNVNIYKQRNSAAMLIKPVFKQVNSDELNIPNNIDHILSAKSGITVISSVTHRKEIAAELISRIAADRNCLIVTIEDIIKYPLRSNNSLVFQREKGIDFVSTDAVFDFTNIMHPDVLYVDLYSVDWQTMKQILDIAEGGTHVIVSIKGFGFESVINRLVEYCPNDYNNMIYSKISRLLNNVISEKVLYTKKDKKSIYEYCHMTQEAKTELKTSHDVDKTKKVLFETSKSSIKCDELDD